MPEHQAQQDGGGKRPRTLGVIVAFWARVAVVGLILAIVAGRLGGVVRALDLASHFQVQYLGV